MIVVKTETILNDHPMTYISDDPADPEPLTPAHLLHGCRLTRLPHEETTVEDLQDPSYHDATRIRRDAQIQSVLLEHFANRWRHKYLTSLQKFYHPSNKGGSEQIKVGDVMLVHDDCPRMNWKMAIVEGLVTGNDGRVRSATIRTRSGVTNRPVMKLYPLEVTDKTDAELIRKEKTIVESFESPTTVRPRCDAAQSATEQIAEWVECIRAPWRMSRIVNTL